MLTSLQFEADLRPFRDVSIFKARVDIPNKSEWLDHRFAIIWDSDRDGRVLDAAAAMYFQHPDLFGRVLSLAESKASLQVVVTGDAPAALDKLAEDAANGVFVGDYWNVEVVRVWMPTKTEVLHGDWPLDPLIYHLCRLGYWQTPEYKDAREVLS